MADNGRTEQGCIYFDIGQEKSQTQTLTVNTSKFYIIFE